MNGILRDTIFNHFWQKNKPCLYYSKLIKDLRTNENLNPICGQIAYNSKRLSPKHQFTEILNKIDLKEKKTKEIT